MRLLLNFVNILKVQIKVKIKFINTKFILKKKHQINSIRNITNIVFGFFLTITLIREIQLTLEFVFK